MDVNKAYILQPFDAHEFIRDEVLVTSEAIELLEISRARMSRMIQTGKIMPIKKFGSTSLFYRQDILAKREELIQLREKYRPYEYE
ncbi:DNA-binding protein [Rossellomorea vietnamensis]|uniref:DNA-binding protein n=1 Tax=Rossellomorea vietnamensis TaxID=218284 RepID=A0A6I6UT11_9BACI|nr:DNA-binding protein [Rossellomorea vietnamensis]QHE63109.1 DNA-binding protein [Rossellomorea vietnamensis]